MSIPNSALTTLLSSIIDPVCRVELNVVIVWGPLLIIFPILKVGARSLCLTLLHDPEFYLLQCHQR